MVDNKYDVPEYEYNLDEEDENKNDVTIQK
jgi:hypothetical protein